MEITITISVSPENYEYLCRSASVLQTTIPQVIDDLISDERLMSESLVSDMLKTAEEFADSVEFADNGEFLVTSTLANKL